MIHPLITPLAMLALLTFSTPAGAQSAPATVAKAYIINEITVTDPAAYAEYVREAPAVVEAFGGRYLVRAGTVTAAIGEPPVARIVVVEFPSHRAAADFLASAEYQTILPIRRAASTSRAYIVDGIAP